MTSVTFTLLFFSILSASSCLANDWPFMKCSRSDPRLNQCLVSAAKLAVPVIARGLPGVGVRALEPMFIDKIHVSVSKGPVKMNLRMNDTNIHGASFVEINSAKFSNDVLSFEGFHKELKLTGNYNLLGKLLFIPINSNGYVEMNLKSLRSIHSVDFRSHPRTEVDFKINTVNGLSFAFSSPQGRVTNRALTKLLNDNWKILLNAFKPEVERVIQEEYTKALKPLFDKFHPSTYFPQ